MNFYLLHLHNISHDFGRSDQLKKTLVSLSKTIHYSIKHAEKVTMTQDINETYVEEIVMEEAKTIEESLGAAFVVCQSYITEIVSGFKKLHVFAKSEKISLGVSGGKKELCKTRSDVVAGSEYTEIQTINAFANYYKHHDEWPVDWEEAKTKSNQTKHTIEIISTIGAWQGSMRNMQKGAESLGCSSYINLDLLIDKISKWRDNLVVVYKTELKRLNKL